MRQKEISLNILPIKPFDEEDLDHPGDNDSFGT